MAIITEKKEKVCSDMKKYFILLGCLLLGACSGHKDQFASYRGEPAHAIYQEARQSLIKSHYHKAVEQLEALDALYPFSVYAEAAQVDMIYAYYQDNEDALAVAAADRYVHLYPRGLYVDYAYYMRGIVELNSGINWLQKRVGVDLALRDVSHLKNAFSSYYTLVTRFPSSPYRTDAIYRMRYIRNLLARNEVVIADFYYKRKAYVAAVNRANEVVQHFQGSPVVEKALALNVKAYEAMGLRPLAEDNLKVLEANFPN